MADQRQRRGGIGLSDLTDEIGEIVLELADIADVAAHAGGAMAANVGRVDIDAARSEPLGQGMDGDARS